MIVGPSMEDQISLSRCRASHSKRSAPLQPIAPCPAFRVPYTPNPSLRGIFAGTASKTMSIVGPAVIALTRRPPRDLSLLYIGTASYDISENRYRQTHEFIKMGVTVKSLDVANQFVHRHEMEEAVNEADIILVSGGNTLYAVDRWERLGLADLLREAAFRGTVIAGGSAGAICWFDGGHSDSMDPSTHRLFKLKTSSENESDDSIKSFHVEAGRLNSSFVAGRITSYEEADKSESDSKKPQLTRVVSLETNMEMDVESDREMDEDSSANDWEYIRVKGLGIFPGLICPHHDCIQSNGVLRSADFRSMMERHPYEVGIGIDNFAALEFDGPNFRVLSMLGVTSPKIKDEVDKVPGVWINYVDGDGTVHSKRCPRAGKVADLLQMLKHPEKHLILDERVELCRKKNPQIIEQSKM
jgi:dipeptidase E